MPYDHWRLSRDLSVLILCESQSASITIVIVLFSPIKVVHFLSPLAVPAPSPCIFVVLIVIWDNVFFDFGGILKEYFEKFIHWLRFTIGWAFVP